MQGLAFDAEDRIQAKPELDAIRLAIKQVHELTVRHLRGGGPAAGDKGKQIGADTIGRLKAEAAAVTQDGGIQQRPITKRLPARRHGKRKGKNSLEVRLIETGEERPGPVRHQQRIQVLTVTIKRSVTTNKRDIDRIGSGMKKGRRDRQVFLLYLHRCAAAVHPKLLQSRRRGLEIQQEGLCGGPGIQHKDQLLLSLYRKRFLRWYGKLQAVVYIPQNGAPVNSQGVRHALAVYRRCITIKD